MADAQTAPAEARRAAPAGADDVFLSPRVVDQAAFHDFAAALRELVDRAAAQAEPLRASTSEAERILAAVREAGARQQSRLDLTLKALAAVDERAQHVERSLQRASDISGVIARFQDQAEHIVITKLSEFATRVQSEAQSAAARIAALESRLSQAEADLNAKLARIDAYMGRGGEKDPGKGESLPALLKRGEALGERASDAVRQLEAVRSQADEAKRILGEAVLHSAEKIDGLREEHEQLQGSLREAVDLCREAGKAMRVREEALREAVDAPISELHARADGAARVLHDEVARAERTAAEARAAAAQHREIGTELRGLLAQLEPWRPLLTGEGRIAGDLPEPLERIATEVRARIARDLSVLSGALAGLVRGAEEAARGMSEPPVPVPLPVPAQATADDGGPALP